MKTMIALIGISLLSTGILSAQARTSQSDTLSTAKFAELKVDSIVVVNQEKIKQIALLPTGNEEFAYETDPIFKMPIAKPRYKSQMPILKPGMEYIYNMPRKQFYPK